MAVLDRRQVVRLASETDFEGWRRAGRRLRAAGVRPAEVLWTVDAEAPAAAETGPSAPRLPSPPQFLWLWGEVALSRSYKRF